MTKDPKRSRWLAGAAAAAGGSMLLLVLSCMGGGPLRAHRLSAREAAELARMVASANQTSEAAFAERANAWRAHFQSARSSEQLGVFVEQLLGYEQKLYQGAELLQKQSDEQRVRALFRKYVLDDSQLVADMQATVEQYEQFLFEQDRPILAAAGVSAADWSRQLKASRPAVPKWNQALEPVVTQAVHEARQDVARFAATWVAGDYAGDGIKSLARSAGLDNTEEGSLADAFTGLVLDATAGLVIDKVMDPTDEIVARLSQRLIVAEKAILEGEEGLLTVLHQTRAAHESARRSLISTSHSR
jgi:hypothetical protein